jgi:TolB-like protein
MSLFAELKRRNVFRVGAAYVAVAWLIIQVVETLFPVFGLGDGAIRIVVILLAIGFLPAVVSAWAFELTPEGFRREAEVDHDSEVGRRMTRRLDRLSVVALALALGFFAFDKFVLDPARDAAELASATERAREEGRAESRRQVRDNSIAVLAFQDLSPEGDQEYFCDGLAIDLLNQLAGNPDLRVTGKTSAFSFKGKDATIPEIAQVLNVGHVLDGSVSKAGERIRVSVQLVDARTDSQLWSTTYDRVLDDIFAIRDEITDRIMSELTVELGRLMPRSLRTDARAYDLTLQARYLLERLQSQADAEQAAELVSGALAIDPDYVPAILEQLYVDHYLMYFGLMDEEDQLRTDEELLDRVLALDPDNGHALALRAWRHWEEDLALEAAARGFGEALATDPGNAETLRLAGIFARSIGRHEASIALLERCLGLDPVNPRAIFHLAQSYLWGGRFEAAEEMHRRLEALSGSKGNLYYLVLSLLLKGEPERALAELETQPDASDGPQLLAARAMIMHDLGRADASAAALAELVARWDDLERESVYLVPEVHAWTGEKDAAFEWLERAYAASERYGVHGYWFQRIVFLPVWRNLHGDPRWTAARERAGMSEARLEALEFVIPSQQ